MRRYIFNDPERVGRWVTQIAGGDWTADRGQAIGVEEDGQLIAGILYEDFNGTAISIHLASSGTRKWLSKTLLSIMFDYPFNQIGASVLLGLVPAARVEAVNFALSLGAKIEHTIPAAHPTGDLVILSMRRADCPWLTRLKVPQ